MQKAKMILLCIVCTDQFEILKELGFSIPWDSDAYKEVKSHPEWKERVYPGEDNQVELIIPDPRAAE